MPNRRRNWTLVFAAVAASGFAAAAADWIEPRYQPAVGSRWIIQRDLFKEERRNENGVASLRKNILRITSELTIEGKTAEGFRLAYRRTQSSYESEDTDAPAMRASLAALENVLVRAAADASGKPLRVENLEDVRKAVGKMIDRLAAAGENPQVAAAVRKLFSRLTKIDAAQAAEELLDELPALALTQNTGLHPGEMRRREVEEPSGIGPPLVKTIALSIASADPASGDVRFRLEEHIDPDSILRFLAAVASQLGRDPNDLKKMEIALDGKTDIEVSGGMTRALHRHSTTSSNLLGNTVVIADRKEVTVRPAQ